MTATADTTSTTSSTLTLANPPVLKGPAPGPAPPDEAIPASSVWSLLFAMIDPATFARVVPMPTSPTGPHVPVTVSDRTGSRYAVQVARGPVITALKLIAINGPEAVTLRLEGFRADGKGNGKAGLVVDVARGATERARV
jgi:hypothetical protein